MPRSEAYRTHLTGADSLPASILPATNPAPVLRVRVHPGPVLPGPAPILTPTVRAELLPPFGSIHQTGKSFRVRGHRMEHVFQEDHIVTVVGFHLLQRCHITVDRSTPQVEVGVEFPAEPQLLS